MTATAERGRPARAHAPAPAPGIFLDRASQPDDAAVAAVLGPVGALWTDLRTAVAARCGPIDEAWAFSGRRHGWSLRLARRGRPLVFLTPLRGAFRASLALPERALPAALNADLPGDIGALVAAAPPAAEGRAVRMEIRSSADVAALVALALIRLAS